MEIPTRVLGILTDIAGMVLAVAILRTSGIFGIGAEQVQAIGDPEAVASLLRLMGFLPTLLIVIIVIATAVKVGKSVLQIFYGRSGPPYPVIKVEE
jgi:hypothetical protein